MSQSARVGCIVEILQCTGCLVDAEDVLCKVSCGRPFRRRLDWARTATTPIIRHILGGVERRTRRNVVRMRSRRGWTVYALPQRPLFGRFRAVWKRVRVGVEKGAGWCGKGCGDGEKRVWGRCPERCVRCGRGTGNAVWMRGRRGVC